METPDYIKSWFTPNGSKARARRVWGIELELVWIPFLTATNTQGNSAIPADALGCPLRLGYNPDGTVKFTRKGTPQFKVAKDLADAVRMLKDNYVAGLLTFANGVYTDNPEGYKLQLEQARVAGEPIQSRDRANLDKALAEAREQAMAEMVAEAERKAKAEARAKNREPVKQTAEVTS